LPKGVGACQPRWLRAVNVFYDVKVSKPNPYAQSIFATQAAACERPSAQALEEEADAAAQAGKFVTTIFHR